MPDDKVIQYRRVADELRRRIIMGELAPGALVPSETQIRDEFQVTRVTAARALEMLRTEGLIYTVPRRGSIVRKQLPVRTISAGRYRNSALSAGPPVLERVTQSAHVEDAMPDVARQLGIPEGAAVVRRRYILHAFGAPQQITDSYVPLAAVAGSPLADLDAELEPEPAGIVDQFAALGVRVTDIEETVWARIPTEDEVQTLRTSPEMPVLRITRRMLAGDKPVEAAVDIVIPADQVEVRYRIRL
jgi:GntR family transcriptional regulator